MKKQIFYLGSIALFLATSGNLSAQTDPEKTTDIEEVVVRGVYGIKQTADELSGSAGKISKETLDKPTGVSIDNLLQGSSPGIMSTAGSGQPGAASITLVRGISSLTSGNSPLYIIDGVPVMTGDISGSLATQNALSLINPNDIEDIQIYKDGVATSLFGSRGANGVIVIKTKSGKKGRSSINLTTEIGTSDIAFEKFNMLSAAEQVQLYARGYRNNSQYSNLTEAEAYQQAVNYFRWDGTTNEDWRRASRRSNPAYSRYNVNFSGGSGNFQIFSSLGYLEQEGVAKNADFKRYTGTLKGDWKANDKLKTSFSINLSRGIQNGALANLSFENPVLFGNLISPTQSIYNADGSYNLNLRFTNPRTNLIGVQNRNIIQGVFDKVLTSLSIDYDIAKYLTYNTSFGIDYTNGEETTFYNPDFGSGYTPADTNGNGYLAKNHRTFLTWNWYNFLNFNKRFGKHDVSATIGFEATQRTSRYNSFAGKGFPAGLDLPYADLAANPTAVGSNQVRWGLVGYVARASYTYNRIATITASARRDGYSGYTDYYGNFYSIGGNVDIARLAGIKEQLRTLTLRASYGQNGNQAVGPYDKMPQYALDYSYANLNGGGIESPGAAIEGLKWEVSNKYNVGLDFALGRTGKIFGSVDLYANKNNQQIFNEQLSLTSGFSQIKRNLADVTSKGIEVSLGANLIRKEDFNWTVNGNYSYNTSEINKLTGGENVSQINGFKAFKVGHNPTEFYTRLWAGVDARNGDPLWYTDETRTRTTNNINNAALSFTGKKALPTHIAGFTNNLQYKGFNLSFTVTYQGDFSVYDSSAWLYDNSGEMAPLNIFASALYDSWTPENTGASNPKFVFGGNRSSNSQSTRYLYDGDFIRLKNVEIGYRIKQETLKINSIQSVYLYLRGTNLLTYAFDKNLYFDPESNSNQYNNTVSNLGVYSATQPMMRQFILGVTMDF
ncbi:MAG: SusC/RagA family TonB-linked outer membrane protein [Cruoricaptor ignavus]|nr:SusC/RagA family TonB-linked outer membrane protein [Cruoricaptor ignavus]